MICVNLTYLRGVFCCSFWCKDCQTSSTTRFEGSEFCLASFLIRYYKANQIRADSDDRVFRYVVFNKTLVFIYRNVFYICIIKQKSFYDT